MLQVPSHMREMWGDEVQLACDICWMKCTRSGSDACFAKRFRAMTAWATSAARRMAWRGANVLSRMQWASLSSIEQWGQRATAARWSGWRLQSLTRLRPCPSQSKMMRVRRVEAQYDLSLRGWMVLAKERAVDVQRSSSLDWSLVEVILYRRVAC